VDPGGSDAVEALNGAGEFAFQGTLTVELLDEIRLPDHAGLVEDLVADGSCGRQAPARKKQACRGDLVAGDHDGRAVSLGLVANVGLVQRLGDFARFLEVQVRIEQGVGLVQVHEHGGKYGDDAHADTREGGKAAQAESLQGG